MFTMALAARAVTAWTGDPGALVEYHVRFGRPVVVPDDDDGTEVTVRGKVGALLEDDRIRVDLTVTSGGEKVLSLARATVRLA
jgi:acyl dehydratase